MWNVCHFVNPPGRYQRKTASATAGICKRRFLGADIFSALAALRAASYACASMLELTQNSQPQYTPPMVTARATFAFVGERLWLDFVNSELSSRNSDALVDFDALVQWLEAASIPDAERAGGIRRRAIQQPAGAAASLIDARRDRKSVGEG